MGDMSKVKIVCSECGSDDVRKDSWACWDIDEQKWVLHETYDYTYCEACEEECSTKDIVI